LHSDNVDYENTGMLIQPKKGGEGKDISISIHWVILRNTVTIESVHIKHP